MKKLQVQLHSIESVKQFVSLATQHACGIDVTSERYVVDGKSMLALFSLDLSGSVGVVYLGDDEGARRFYAQLSEVVPVAWAEEEQA